ncbi:MAG TPA: hypothetical protein VGH38_31765 [Bryobacteraceae bacterium]|jgi:hypothetical protein
MIAVEAIAASGAVAGVLDISATGAVMRAQGVPFARLLRFVASGALGPSALEGGAGTAGFGLALHFLIAGLWAFLYYVAADRWPALLGRPVLWGAVLGVVAHLVMSLVVVPLSRARRRPFAWKAWLTQLAIHIVCVGVPIAMVQSYALR